MAATENTALKVRFARPVSRTNFNVEFCTLPHPGDSVMQIHRGRITGWWQIRNLDKALKITARVIAAYLREHDDASASLSESEINGTAYFQVHADALREHGSEHVLSRPIIGALSAAGFSPVLEHRDYSNRSEQG